MKRIAQILIIMALLMIPVQFQVEGNQATPTLNYLNTESDESISLSQIDTLNGAFSRPILVSVSNTTTGSVEISATRERNDTLGEGAIHEVGIYDNVTVQYKVVNGNENTTVRLYLDVPASNYTLSLAGNVNESIVMDWVSAETELVNITLPYDLSNEIQFVNVSIYKAEFNMTEDYITYFAAVYDTVSNTVADASRESLNAPFNFITTSNYWVTESEDEFYIQEEEVLINLVANNSKGVDRYGIAYRTNSFGDYTNINFTDSAATDYTQTINLGEFSIGTTLEWKSYAYVTDAVDSKVRYIERVDFKSVKIEDGTPSITSSLSSNDTRSIQVDETFYSIESKVNFTLNASVVKGVITDFNLTLGDESIPIVATGNVSTSGETFNLVHDFVNEGIYDVVLTAITDKDIQINNTYTVVIDATLPTVTLDQPGNDPNIDTTSGRVTFTFNYTDALSGVRLAILDLGDDTSIQVNGLDELSYRYIELDRLYIVTLTIIDFAGNEISSTISISLNKEEIEDTTAPVIEFWLFLITVIVLIAAYVNRERLSNLRK
ncbi:MAG: hypothetical protein GPJ54_13595 [Candidatus Heimdallarchaeota archaeon]|nr:hypothetical protein [Candidatus Heimdallarchaeota archaeon]